MKRTSNLLLDICKDKRIFTLDAFACLAGLLLFESVLSPVLLYTDHSFLARTIDAQCWSRRQRQRRDNRDPSNRRYKQMN